MIVTIQDGFYIPARGDIITLDTVGNEGFNLEYAVRLSSLCSENSKILGIYETKNEAEHYIREIAEYVLISLGNDLENYEYKMDCFVDFVTNGRLSKSKITDINGLKKAFNDSKFNLSCQECAISKTCKTLHFVYKQRLKNYGYAMHKNEFYCNQFEAIF